MSKKRPERKPKIDPILECIQKKEITHLVGIDESRNGSLIEYPIFVSSIRKLNDLSFNELTKKSNFTKLRPSKGVSYINTISNIIKDHILSWFYYCDLIKDDKYNRCDQTMLTLATFIRYLGDNFISLNKTLILIDGKKLCTKNGVTLEGLIDPFQKEMLNIKFIVEGDKKYEVIRDADTIAYNLAYGDKNKKIHELIKRFPEKHIDLQYYLKKRGTIGI